MFGRDDICDGNSIDITVRFVRDKRLMEAGVYNNVRYHYVRKDYCKRVNEHPELKEIEKNQDNRLNAQIKKNERKHKKQNRAIFAVVVAVFLFAGVNASFLFDDYLSEEQNTTISTTAKGCGVIALYGIMGIMMGYVCSDFNEKHWTTKNADMFYKRFVVRYFNKLRIENPKITHDTIMLFNPELARVVCGVLVANLSKKDMEKMDNLALTIATEFWSVRSDKNLKAIDNTMDKAIKIVEKAMAKNPELYKLVQDVYMGEIPSTFVLANNYKNLGLQR